MHIDHKIKELGVSGSSFDGMESVVYGLRSRPAPLIRQGTVGHPEHFSWPEVVWKQAKNNKAAWLFFFLSDCSKKHLRPQNFCQDRKKRDENLSVTVKPT